MTVIRFVWWAVVASLLVAAAPSTARAEEQRGAVPPASTQGIPNPMDLEVKMAAAVAGANKPGDVALGCEAIQKELVATVKDPAMQAVFVKQGAWAQQQIDKLNAVPGAPTGSVAAQLLTGFAPSFVPGLGAAGMAAQAAQAQAMEAQATMNQQQMMQRMQGMSTILPQLMRSQRLVELGQARKCEWAPVAMLPGAVK
jgi:hypothetical protein